MSVGDWLRNQMATPGAGFFDSLSLLDKSPIAEQPVMLAQNGSFGIDKQYKDATGASLTQGDAIPGQSQAPQQPRSQPIANQLTKPSGYAMPDSEPVIKDGAKTLFGR